MRPYLAIAACLCVIATAQDDSTLSTTTDMPVTSEEGGGSCSGDSTDVFNIMVDFEPTSVKRDFVFPRQEETSQSATLPSCTGAPVLSLKGNVMLDQLSRVCSIVSNHQFQCDPPPGQDNAIRTSGWAICPPSTSSSTPADTHSELQISGSANFHLCKSQDPITGRMFFNIYDNDLPSPPPQCTRGTVKVVPCTNSTSTSSERAMGKRAVAPWVEVEKSVLVRELEALAPKVQGRLPFPLGRRGLTWGR